MMTPKHMIIAGVAGLGLLFGSHIYGDWSSRAAVDARIKGLESQIQAGREAEAARTSELTTELNLIENRVGVTAQDTQTAQKAANAARAEQARTATALRQSLDEHSKAVDSLRVESGTRIEEVRQEATTQIGAVTGEVGTVRVDLDATKSDLAASRREIGDVRDSLGRQIARNSDELTLLKRRGERNYYEFDIPKTKDMKRVANIQIQLTKADLKASKYDVMLQVDDNKVQKKGQIINEPIQILVGRDHLRYELVVNTIDKDRIRGYVSTPKDGTLSAEGPVSQN